MGASEHTEWIPPGVRWPVRPDIGPQWVWPGTSQGAKAAEGASPAVDKAGAETGAVNSASRTPEPKFFEDGAPSFMDLLDIINPLQHIPVISSIYRELTGDTIGHTPRIAGGALFFGPIGAGIALANAFINETSGRDVGEHMIALLTKEAPAPTMVADAEKTPPDAVSLASIETAAGLPPVPLTAAGLTPVPAAAAEQPRPPEPTFNKTAGPIPIETLPPELRDALRQQKRPEASNDAGAHKLAQRKAKEPMVPASMARRQWATDADAFAAAAPKKKKDAQAEAADTEPKQETRQETLGAVAPEGGWFSKTMLDALEKYQNTSKLTESKETPAVTVVN
ncbi:MAG: hypothetical protein EXQ86_02820 [Rhodospirillales bacterium]|nr:hypothetical protein [Rhodospirillales bacterium]